MIIAAYVQFPECTQTCDISTDLSLKQYCNTDMQHMMTRQTQHRPLIQSKEGCDQISSAMVDLGEKVMVFEQFLKFWHNHPTENLFF